MTAGQLVYRLYHQPIGRVRQCIRNGGPFAERETERQRKAMEAAAGHCGALPLRPGIPLTIHLMTGQRFWYQTVFCLHSLARVVGVPIHAELYDDGSLDGVCTERLQRLGPGVRIHLARELRLRLDHWLPADKFPALRDRYEKYPNIRKLIDVHAGSSGWKLVLDSDLLFFRHPTEMVAWLAAPDVLLHAVDCDESYGYSRGLLERIAGAALPRLVNVGVCGIRSASVDWLQLERWVAALHAAEGTNYYLEQALVAMLAATQPHRPLAASDYVTFPSRAEVEHPRAVMHHYVHTSKRWYFRYGWRHLTQPGAAT